jgi:hypothetical protein
MDSVDALEEFLELRGIEARAIEAPAWVEIGTAYDGANFVEPTPEPETTTEPIPLTIEQVRHQLDALREQATAEYIARWGNLSKQELWPLLDAEIVRAVGDTAETINPEKYPAIVGFLEASGQPTVGAAVFAAAAGLRQHKVNHVSHLRRSELLREQLINDYTALANADRLAWNAVAEWAEGVATWG